MFLKKLMDLVKGRIEKIISPLLLSSRPRTRMATAGMVWESSSGKPG